MTALSTPAKAPTKRDVLIEAATRLFVEKGFRTTGIAEILTTAGVAKGTLYQHFCSKDALIEAVLQRMGDGFRVRFLEAVEASGTTPRERLLAVFRVQHEMVWGHQGYCGCPFSRVAGEFADPEHPVHRVAAMNKRMMTVYLADLAHQAGAADPEGLARQLALILEGAAVMHAVAGQGDVTGSAEAAGRTLIDSALAAASA
jgi:AcrR family transcriptional regulator